MPPQRYLSESPESVNVNLYNKRDFGHVIILKILRWGDYPSIWYANLITRILIREKHNTKIREVDLSKKQQSDVRQEPRSATASGN